MPKSKKKSTEDEIARENLHGQQAENLFPGLFPKATQEKLDAGPTVSPPPPPASWEDNDDPDSRGEDAGNYALILVRDADQQTLIAETLAGMGYTTVAVPTAVRGIEELRAAPYQLVLCGTDTTFARFRDYLTKNVPTPRRRLIFYTLLGPHLHTCYNMEALAMSANLVVNEKDLPHLEGVLRKGFQTYERLFGPYLELLQAIERLAASARR